MAITGEWTEQHDMELTDILHDEMYGNQDDSDIIQQHTVGTTLTPEINSLSQHDWDMVKLSEQVM